jgi:hypothetical protein
MEIGAGLLLWAAPVLEAITTSTHQIFVEQRKSWLTDKRFTSAAVLLACA